MCRTDKLKFWSVILHFKINLAKTIKRKVRHFLSKKNRKPLKMANKYFINNSKKPALYMLTVIRNASNGVINRVNKCAFVNGNKFLEQ